MTEFYETLELIVDSKDSDFDSEAFAKELGVGCDRVGWMRLDLGKDFDKLKQISELAKEKGLKLRGNYEKKLWIPWRNGIGKKLFKQMCLCAEHMKADRIFISVIPSYDTISFYFNMGCLDAIYIVDSFVDTEYE